MKRHSSAASRKQTPSSVWEYGLRHATCEVCRHRRTSSVHHRHPKTHARSYQGLDVHEEANLCAVCWDCHEIWGWARHVGHQPNPHGDIDGYCQGYYTLLRNHPGHAWHRMAPQWLIDAYRDWLATRLTTGKKGR